MARGEAPKKLRGLSWHAIQNLTVEQLCQWCFEAGFLQDRRGESCPKCGLHGLQLHETRCAYACPARACRYEESVTKREPGLFLERVPLPKQLQVLYRMVYHNAPGAREIAADVDMDYAPVLHIMKSPRDITTFWMRRANALLQVGGVDTDNEMDEVSFRSKKVEVVQDDGQVVPKTLWWRFLAAGRRGSSLVYLADLEDRLTEAGQGGGGKISDSEVEHHILREWLRELGHQPRPLLAPWSVLHTDGADAYRKLHRVLGIDLYRPFNYWHTWVRHSRKKHPETGAWMPVQFTVRKRIKLRSGAVDWRKGGTQKKDGFFASLRRHVSRRAIPSCDRGTLRGMCYFYQWMYWRTRDPEADALRGHHDRASQPLYDLMFELGRLRKKVRALLCDQALADPDWLAVAEPHTFDALPTVQLPERKRIPKKQQPRTPNLGARPRKDPVGGPARKRGRG